MYFEKELIDELIDRLIGWLIDFYCISTPLENFNVYNGWYVIKPAKPNQTLHLYIN